MTGTNFETTAPILTGPRTGKCEMTYFGRGREADARNFNREKDAGGNDRAYARVCERREGHKIFAVSYSFFFVFVGWLGVVRCGIVTKVFRV